MPTPRSQLISLEDTPWYHCISRCVRRAWLCGYDKESGTDYEYRREWIVDRIKQLSRAFSIEVASYCVMHNHHHEVLRVDADSPKNWPIDEVVRRWHLIYKGTFLSQRYAAGHELSKAEMSVVKHDAREWKERLFNISWFMRALNEPIARSANIEDDCKGKFFESRFKSQGLLDEKAILATMAYVDLNPIRAAIAETLETSDYTSIKLRIESIKNNISPSFLAPFSSNEKNTFSTGIPYHLLDYIELVDWTGRAVLQGKRGSVDGALPPILQKLGLEPSDWITFATEVESQFSNWVGSPNHFSQTSSNVGQRWICASSGSRRFY